LSDCKNIEGLLWDYVSGSISESDRIKVESHISTCANCADAFSTVLAVMESKEADLKQITEINPDDFDSAVMGKIHNTQSTRLESKTDSKYVIRMSVSMSLAAAVVLFMLLSISDLAQIYMPDRVSKSTTGEEKEYDIIDIELKPKSIEAPKAHRAKKEKAPEEKRQKEFSVLSEPIASPSPDSVNIGTATLTDETVPLISQQVRGLLHEVVVDTGLIQAAGKRKSMMIPVEKMPSPLNIITPEYPVSAMKRGISGLVWVKAHIDSSGAVSEAEIVSSENPGLGFEESALEAALKSKYIPAEANGLKMPVWILYPVKFIFNSQ